MSGLRDMGANALVAAGYVAGLAGIWAGVEALVLGGGEVVRALGLLALGFGVWVVLAAIARATSGEAP